MRAWLLALLMGGVGFGAGTWYGGRRATEAPKPAAQAAPAPAPTAAAPEVADDEDVGEGPRAARPERGGRRAAGFLNALGRAAADGRDGGAEPQPGDNFEARRQRRQERMRELLGRRADETEEQYRERVAPMVKMALSMPRSRVDERRREFEAAAQLDDAQRGELDAAIADATAELLAQANASVAKGDLTPYRRNTLGVLSFVSGSTATLEAFDARVRKTLSPEQLQLLDDTGFDLVEYLAVSTPWETMNPPPPAP